MFTKDIGTCIYLGTPLSAGTVVTAQYQGTFAVRYVIQNLGGSNVDSSFQFALECAM